MSTIFLKLNKRKIRFIAFLIIAVFLSINIYVSKVYAVENDLKFNRITIEDGLSQGTVEAIFQDSKGYMYFGSAEGLNRYDGHGFKVYRYNINDNNSISSNYVDAIIEDQEGFLWVGTSNGLNKMDTNNGTFTRYLNDSNSPNSISHSNVWAIIQDKKGYIWIGTEKGLNKYDKNTNTFKRYFYDDKDENSLSHDFVTSLCEDSEGNIWVGTKNGLNELDPETNKFKRYLNSKDDPDSLSDNYVLKVFEDVQGTIWVGTQKSGLNKFVKSTGKFRSYVNDINNLSSLPSNTVRAIYQDKYGDLWVGTNKGLSKLISTKEEFINFKNKYYDTYSIVHDTVMSLFQDKTGMLWVGTNSGISKFYPRPDFRHYKSNPVEPNSLSENMVSGIYEDSEGILWVGTFSKGLNKINRKSGEINSCFSDSQKENSLSSDAIRSITEDKSNNLWIATNRGLDMLQKSTGNFVRYFNDSKNENSLVNNEVKHVYVDSRGILWIGTRQGLDSLDLESKTFTHYNDLLTQNNIGDFYISYIYEDKKGIFWIGTGINGGLIKYNREKNIMKVYKNDPDNINSISSNSIKSIAEDNKGNLWLATDYGLNKFDPVKETFTRYTEDSGLSNNYVYGVLIDELDNPWVSSNMGISKFEAASNEFINFNVTDGLQGNEFNSYSFFKSSSGEMFFGGLNGLNSFYPLRVSIDDSKSKVTLEQFKVYDKAVPFKDKISLKYNESYFSFEFFLPDYKSTSRNQYAYMLKGIDKDWVYASKRNYASYTHIPGGKYTFMVKGRNSNGKWSEPTTIEITVKRAPWNTDLAYLIYSLVVILVVYLVWNYVKILENLVRQRTLELNNKLEENEELYNKLIKYERIKNNYFVNLSHELRTPLNVILSTVQLVSKLNNDNVPIGREKLKNYIDIVKRNSNSLLKVINNLIDTSKIDSGQYKLNIEKTDIVFLVEEVALSLKEYIEDNGLELIVDTDTEEKIIECDPVEIERCVVNLISNAVKFTPRGGSIWVNIYDNSDYIQISVKDNGIGIAEENQVKIFDRFSQIDNSINSTKTGSGIGLTLVKSLVEMHGGSIALRSKLNDGSEFIITLPAEYRAID